MFGVFIIMELEIWKEIQGYSDYGVSNLGRVRSIKYGKEKILKGGIDGAGYYYVNLWKNGKVKNIKIHKLVAIAFLNHQPCGLKLVVNHIDFNKLNNHVDNLEVISQRENTNRKHLKSSSKFIGVHWNKQNKKWFPQIVINGKQIYLGSFTNEEEAGKVYELALENIDKYNGNKKEFREFLRSILD